MAIRSVTTTDTLGTFRTTFNTLSTDLGDLQDLNTSNKSSVVASINEAITQTSSFFLRDSGSSIQEVSSGDTVNIIGDSSNITTTISATDTIEVALSSTVTGLTSLDATTLTEGGVQVATKPFAIAQAIALG